MKEKLSKTGDGQVSSKLELALAMTQTSRRANIDTLLYFLSFSQSISVTWPNKCGSFAPKLIKFL